MEEEKVCHACKSNQVARSYQNERNPEIREFYCLECYSRLFLDGGEEEHLKICPHCGISLSEVRAGKLVGCARCYKAMWSGIFPLVEKMQGVRAHRGKTPPVEEYGELFSPYAGEENPLKRASYRKQCNELSVLSRNLKAEGDEEGGRYYEEKLTALKDSGTLEEDFECRTRQNLSKQS